VNHYPGGGVFCPETHSCNFSTVFLLFINVILRWLFYCLLIRYSILRTHLLPLLFFSKLTKLSESWRQRKLPKCSIIFAASSKAVCSRRSGVDLSGRPVTVCPDVVGRCGEAVVCGAAGRLSGNVCLAITPRGSRGARLFAAARGWGVDRNSFCAAAGVKLHRAGD